MTRAGICLATLGALVASAASAQGPAPASFRVISPIFGQFVTFSMPASFVVVAENSTGPNYIREAVLKGETVNRWTQMITVTGAKGAGFCWKTLCLSRPVLLITTMPRGPASKQAVMVCYRHTALINDGQNTCGSPWSVPAISA